MMARISFSKPLSSIRSASSRTRYDTLIRNHNEHRPPATSREADAPTEITRSIVHQVQKPTRRPNDNPCRLAVFVSILECLHLGRLVYASKDGDARDPERLTQFQESIVRLDGEFAGWCYDQHGDCGSALVFLRGGDRGSDEL